MNRRRIRVVDNVFQYRMIAILLLIVVCGFAAFTAGALIVFAIARARGFAIPGERMLSIFPPILANDIVIMIILIVAGIYVTLRIAGPCTGSKAISNECWPVRSASGSGFAGATRFPSSRKG